MNEYVAKLAVLYEACIQLSRELKECLCAERAAAIALQIAELSEATMRKDQVGRALADRRKELREGMLRWFGANDLESIYSKLSPIDRENLEHASGNWQREWEETYRLCEQNQRFLKASVKNLALLVDHFKQLLGEKPTYSAKGTKVDRPFQGKVIEGRF